MVLPEDDAVLAWRLRRRGIASAVSAGVGVACEVVLHEHDRSSAAPEARIGKEDMVLL
jgi:hypothetical protein